MEKRHVILITMTMTMNLITIILEANSCGDNGKGGKAKAASVKYHNIRGQKQDASNSIPASEPRHTRQSRLRTFPSSQHSQIPGTLLGLIKVAKGNVITLN